MFLFVLCQFCLFLAFYQSFNKNPRFAQENSRTRAKRGAGLIQHRNYVSGAGLVSRGVYTEQSEGARNKKAKLRFRFFMRFSPQIIF
jgi:uncharacterized protein (DUF2225 family)